MQTGRSEGGARHRHRWTGVSMNAQVQTEMSNSQMVERERALAVREGELEVNKFRSRQEADHRERGVIRREREADIRECMVEERAQEYIFKQKELN